ncbi:MAG: hypothetical protein II295_01530 [Akkermansia sp.]|nr:hypothetical protein [Akkermansia sp.]
MKTSLSLLTIAALMIGTASGATEDNTTSIRVSAEFPLDSEGRYEIPSLSYGAGIAPSATLVNTQTGGFFTYDEGDEIDVIKAPFEINEGLAFTTLTLNLSDVELSDANKLVIDFTTVAGKYQPQLWGLFLNAGYTADYTGDWVNDDVDYLIITISGIDFASWYQENGPVEIVGRFSTGGSPFEATAYVITDACDTSSYGGLVFFSEDVTPSITTTTLAYRSIPEPATATLSLLTLAGLATRRRRK